MLDELYIYHETKILLSGKSEAATITRNLAKKKMPSSFAYNSLGTCIIDCK
jgi:hypothetical protein